MLTKGFTLIELLLSVALIGILFSVSSALYERLPYEQDLTTAVLSSEMLLRRAELSASAVDQDAPWGVHFETSRAILFAGVSYETRDSTFDEYVYLSGVTVSGTTDYLFQRVRGLPEHVGTTTLTSTPKIGRASCRERVYVLV